jgi:hypothetical protein
MIIVLIVGLWLVAAAFKSVCDTLAFRFKKSIFKNRKEDWWNPSKSWRNMYKNGKKSNGASFIGSTSIFKFITDAWNMFDFLSHGCFTLGIVMLLDMEFGFAWWVCVIMFLVLQLSYMLMYEVMSKAYKP